MTNKAYNRLLERIKEISYLNQVNSLLRWDQETHMPQGAVEDRAQQLALMSGIVHDRQTAPELGKLLKELGKAKGLDKDQKVIIREVSRDYKRATAVPAELVKEISKTETLSMNAWVKAKKENDFSKFRPWLEKMFSLKMKVAEHIGYEDRPYDALLDEYEPTMLTKDVERILTRFRKKLVPLVSKIVKKAAGADVDESCLVQRFDTDKQKDFMTMVVKDLGYDFEHGRMDITHHPFTIGSANDIRITTRYNENDIRPALFACIHEAGHGIYEQGHLKKYHHTPLGLSASLGIHESQSRMYENIIGRSLAFWEHYYKPLVSTFPQLKKVGLDEWHRAINMVRPSLIRVEADEVTYNLHILIRFELELEITEGKLKAKEVPTVWNEKYEKYLGISPRTDSEGCLQDVHWSFGLLGYFSTYTLGNLLSLQLWDRIKKDLPDVEDQVSNGRFSGILGWLREKVHKNGRRYMFQDLCRHATGAAIDESYFLDYLRTKFGALFDTKF